jgi:glyoxylase-like metal-dependent hydrolase (beta-lactamase superfamily II)
MEILPNVHLIPGIIANPYLIIEPEGLTLIDTGIPGSENKILQYIKDLGRAPRDLKRILLTHSDLDHVGSLPALKLATGAQSYASDIEARAIALGKPSRPIKPANPLRKMLFLLLRFRFKAIPFRVDELLKDGQILPVLGGLRVVDTAGHTPGHISLYAPALNLLFVGDSMVSDQNGLYVSRPANTWDEEKAKESVVKQAALGASTVCPGHGPVVTEAQNKFPSMEGKTIGI